MAVRFVGTPRVGLTTSPYGRDYRFGYGLGVLKQGTVNFELGVDAQRRESPMQGRGQQRGHGPSHAGMVGTWRQTDPVACHDLSEEHGQVDGCP